jgi:hypothetical protein
MSSTPPAASARFRAVALAVGAFSAIACVATFVFVLRDGGRTRAFGWLAVRQPDGAYVLQVTPNGPADGTLRTGDVVVALDGDRSIGSSSPMAARQFILGDTEYTVTVRRDGREVTVPLKPALVASADVQRRTLFYAISGAVWCTFAAIIGLVRSGQPVARAAAGAGIAMGLFFFTQALGLIVPMRSTIVLLLQRAVFPIVPMHLAIGFDFYLRFPRNAPAPPMLRRLRTVLYVVCGALALRGVTDLVAFAGGRTSYAAGRVLLDPVDFWFFWITQVVSVLTGLGLIAAMTHNYRHVARKDDRRRLRWIVWGTVAGVVPFAVVSALRVFLPIAPGLRPIILAGFAPANYATIAIPVCFGYAIATQQVFDISFVVRRGLQYLLARHALRALVLLPVAVLAYGLVVHRDQPVGRLLLDNSPYIYWLAAAILGLRFRAPLARWVDRRFFREAYNRERILVKLVEDVGRLDSGSSVSKLVSHEVEAAFHPRCLFIWYREAERPALTLAYSSGGYIHTAELGPGAPLAQMAEREGRLIDLTATGAAASLPDADRAWLAESGVRLIVPMIAGDRRLIGLLMLGDKKSEEPYSSDDLTLLQAIARQIALARENARLQDRVDDDRRVRHDVLSKLDTTRVNLLKECPSCGTCYDASVETCRADGAELTLSLPVERTIDGKYRLERLLGKGGMGAVYEASDLRLARSVAVKILLGRAFGDRQALRRFEREAQASARLTHPNVVAVYDFGPVGPEGAFIAMELVRGRTLRDELRRHGARPPAVAAAWFEQIGAGVAAAHAQGIVHRDLKPENAIIASAPGAADRVKVLDFGLAKLQTIDRDETGGLTQAGAVMGTAGYMAPEQLTGGEIDERTDIFALGVMVAEAVTGTRPFDGRTTSELLLAILQTPLRLPGDGPHWRQLERALQRAVAKAPGDRYRSVDEFAGHVLPALRAFPPVAASGEEPTRMA